MFNPESPPEITASRWYNGHKATLKSLRGKVVVVAVFQILCPGSVKYGLPQAMRLRHAFNDGEVAVIGLHMAFEHFDKQSPDKVDAFLKQNNINIPVAYDKPNGEDLPATMKDYELQGTPAILIFDRQGRVRRHYIGAVDDFRIGAEVMALLMEDTNSPREFSIGVEKKLAAALVDPDAHHHHEGGCCGHDHAHEHHHSHEEERCGGHHHHANDHDHDHATGDGCCGGKGGCGCKG